MFEQMINMMTALPTTPSAVCAYAQCSCHINQTTNTKVSLKACAACGVVSYCCKESQAKDWHRHKKTCIGLRPFKAYASQLSPMQKSVLNSLSYDIPPILCEYAKKYPQSPIHRAHHLYIQGGLDAVKTMISTNLSNLSAENDYNIADMMKRWQEYTPEIFEFIKTGSPGDINRNKSYLPYNPPAPQQFRNNPVGGGGYGAVLTHGETLVDVGFVDFGLTFDSIDTLDPTATSPVTVLAYDMNPFCVAKSMVMMRMMQDCEEEVSPRSLVEVWLSSLWSKTTFKAFKRATGHILETDNDAVHDKKLDERVKTIVKFWNAAPKMTRESALVFQGKGLFSSGGDSTFAMNCCALEKEEDRVMYLRYYLTKALYEDDTTTLGSVVMNTVKEDIGIKQAYASCFEIAPFKIHLDMQDPTYSQHATVVGRTKAYFENNMKAFMNHVRNGTLVFHPKIGELSQSNQHLINEIKSAKPYIISWSNVVDYIDPKSFHKMAKEMSSSETVHYLHSCNWTSRVYGTDIYDIDSKHRLHFFSAGLHAIKNGVELNDGFVKEAHVKHFRGVCGTVLARKFVNRFFQFFFEDQEVKCSCFNGITPLSTPYPFARDESTAHIIFAYSDTGIDFGEDTYDFNSD